MTKWDARFMRLAAEAAGWSKDPDEGVGAVIVSVDKRQFSFGYNGFPKGFPDTPEALGNKELKNDLTIHAERNALDNCPFPLSGTTLYCTKAPCLECMKGMIQKGVHRLVYPGVRPESRWFQNQIKALQLAKDMGAPLCEIHKD